VEAAEAQEVSAADADADADVDADAAAAAEETVVAYRLGQETAELELEVAPRSVALAAVVVQVQGTVPSGSALWVVAAAALEDKTETLEDLQSRQSGHHLAFHKVAHRHTDLLSRVMVACRCQVMVVERSFGACRMDMLLHLVCYTALLASA